MLWRNGIKVAAVCLMLFGTHPLICFTPLWVWGQPLTPRKVRHPGAPVVRVTAGQSQRIEGRGIRLIILGVLLGGQLVAVSSLLLAIDLPLINTGIDSAPEAANPALVYGGRHHLLNTHIPDTAW